MKKRLFFVVTLAFTLVAFKSMVSLYALPWPPMQELNMNQHGLEDALFIVSGFRRAAADVAWVQWLQYVGSREDSRLPRKLALLKEMTLRVTRIDPYFHLPYLYGAGILAWSPAVNRPEEAIEVLREGLRYSPEYWPFQTYLAAILYKQKGNFPEMAVLLEKSITHPECPTIIKSILANYYKATKQYREAVRIWENVLSVESDVNYHDVARRQIAQMAPLVK